MRLDELDFELPEELIAQSPPSERSESRLLVLDRDEGRVSHHMVNELPKLLRPSHFVVNDTRVIPARLHGHKPSGGRAELLLLERLGAEGEEESWRALGRANRPLGAGTQLEFSGEGTVRLSAYVESRNEEGTLVVVLRADGAASVREAVDSLGVLPLPPYIRRPASHLDRDRYQTIFAEKEGAVAAPTAGLHFSESLVRSLLDHGHTMSRVTLHVGAGTFQPIRHEDLGEHRMHEERYEVSESAAEAIEQARSGRRPIICVGTTVVRTLESAADANGRVLAGHDRTRLFIQPGYAFRATDGLLTNFHLPRSTLIALVMALGGVEAIRAAYRIAVEERYRFFSYGDAMLIRDGTTRPCR